MGMRALPVLAGCKRASRLDARRLRANPLQSSPDNRTAHDMTPGQAAPDFDALDQHGTRHSLTDYRGRWLALYFYPRDDTPGCTKQACSIRDGHAALAARGLTVLGVSAQGAAAHAAFAGKFGLDFPLLIDDGLLIARRYGALGSGPIALLRGWLGLYRRISVLIDPEGRIARVIERPDVSRHADELLALLPPH